MITENNWLSTNIETRLTNLNSIFNVSMNLYNFTPTATFKDAADSVVQKIAALNRPIYIGFSGGADSEYVVRRFHAASIPFTAITVATPGNEYELRYAYRVYNSIPAIQKYIINLSAKDILLTLKDEFIAKINSNALNSIPPYFAAKYAYEQGGIFISGDNIFDGTGNYGSNYAVFSEWDYYYDALINNNFYIPFFLYDLPLFHQYVNALTLNKKEDDFKEDLYGTMFRPKFYYHYDEVENFYLIKKKIEGKKWSGLNEVAFSKDVLLTDLDQWKS